MAKSKRKIAGFKKFSDMKKTGKSKKIDGEGKDVHISEDEKRPMNPNLSKGSEKVERTISRKNLIPKDQNVNLPNDDDVKKITDKGEVDSPSDVNNTNEGVEFIGKVAKFKDGGKASSAYNLLEKIKVPKKSIWYIMVEKQENELQMVKYNYNEGVNLGKFVQDLKDYYLDKHTDESICEKIENIKIGGVNEFSTIKNIPNIKVGDKKLITSITEDLIKLLSK